MAQCANKECAVIRIALDESIKLQAHYAELLNRYDGGQRTVFNTADEWIKRLQEMAEPIVCKRSKK